MLNFWTVFNWSRLAIGIGNRNEKRKLETKNELKSRSKWSARPAINGCTQQRGVVCTLITWLFALIDFWWSETHLRRGRPIGEFSQVASLGEMTLHCESECSANTKLSTGRSSPALATCTALRERKDMAFTTPPYTRRDRKTGSGRRGDWVKKKFKRQEKKKGK